VSDPNSGAVLWTTGFVMPNRWRLASQTCPVRITSNIFCTFCLQTDAQTPVAYRHVDFAQISGVICTVYVGHFARRFAYEPSINPTEASLQKAALLANSLVTAGPLSTREPQG